MRVNFSIFVLLYSQYGKDIPRTTRTSEKIEAAKTEVTIGAEYWHFKSRDKRYLVIGLGFLEATNELCVIYQSLYGERLTFLRPLYVWLETVAREGKAVPRFNKL